MLNKIYANIDDLNNKKHHIEPYSNDIWIIVIIMILLFVYRGSNLLLQYLFSIIILFMYMPKYGILYANLIFFIYNMKYFLTINNIYIKVSVILNIIISLFILMIYFLNVNYCNYITLPILNICTIISNLYLLFYLKKLNLTCFTKL